ncbi:MAG TPA: DUF222 domain-containing protein [Actinomycetes bacterium]|nr:DUF222 domain-containing protein [Actinomycetes bacterium]
MNGRSSTAAESLSSLSDAELETALIEAQRTINQAEAQRADLVNELLRRSRAAEPTTAWQEAREPFVADHIAVLLTCTKAVANCLLDTAVEASHHPALTAAWRSGDVDSRKVAVIAESLRHIDRALADAIAGQAVVYGRTRTPTQLRVWLGRRVLSADPSTATIRRRHAMGERKVTLTPLADGMAELAAYLPAVQARQIYDTVNAAARAAAPGDLRTMDQRRSDCFVDLVMGRAEPPRVNVNLVVTAETLDDSEGEPGWIAGVGAVPGVEVKHLASSADDIIWRTMVVDSDTGALTSMRERTYRPSARLDRAIRARDLTCRFPGCRRSAVGTKNGTDVDHTIPWPEGATTPGNLAVLCRHHHRLKHSLEWHVVNTPEGTMTWTTPGGRTIVTTPWEYIDRPPSAPD